MGELVLKRVMKKLILAINDRFPLVIGQKLCCFSMRQNLFLSFLNFLVSLLCYYV